MPTTVLRRYTPPTCTLKIAANGSALSRWTDRTVLKNLRFDLSFDDPKRSPDELIHLSGDRAQLEALNDAVSAYVQQFLDPQAVQHSPALLKLTPDQEPITSATAALALFQSIAGLTEPPALVSDPALSSVTSDTLEERLRLAPANGRSEEIAHTASNQDSAKEGIYLQPKGLLTHELHLGTLATNEVSTVSLGVTQLFDLSNALDEYAAESLSLPAAERPAWLQPSNGWLRVAAVMVLALGVTGSLVQFAADITAPASQSVATNQEPALPPPLTANPAGTDPLTVDPALPTVPSSDTIPLPPPSGVFKQPGSGVPGAFSNPSLIPPTAGAGVRVPVPSASGSQSIQVPTGGRAPVPTVVPAPPVLPPDQIASAPRSPNVVPPGARQPAPMAMEAAPSAADSSATALRLPQQTDASNGLGAASAPSTSARSSNVGNIPQVAEAKTFFQARWQPPETLDRPLEYRLQVAPDGTVQRAIPLGDAAGNYLDRTGMPLIGEPFVSPIESGQSALIRLVLYPDGRVQTLLEELN